MNIDETMKNIVFRKEENEIVPSLNINNEEKILIKTLNPYQCFTELQKIFLQLNTDSMYNNRVKSRIWNMISSLDENIELAFCISMLSDEDHGWRAAACERFKEITNPLSILSLSIKLLTDKHGNVRYAAAETLEEIGDESALPFLEYARDYDKGEDFETFEVSQMSAQAIKSIRDRGKLDE